MTVDVGFDNDTTRSVTEQAMTWPERARALPVTDTLSYHQASDLLLGIKALRREVDEAFDPIIADANRTHRTACDKKRVAEAPLLEAERLVKLALATYAQQQERLRVQEERRLQEEARQREEQRRLEEAATLELEGNRRHDPELLYDAQQLIEQPVVAPPVSVASTTPKVAGIVHRDSWSACVTDVRKLVQFVAAHPEHQNLLTVNQTALNQLARAMKANLKIDGVQAVNTPTVAAGRS